MNQWNGFFKSALGAVTPAIFAVASVSIPSPAKAVDIMPMGDSITAGLNACGYRTPLVQSLNNLPNCSFSMVGTQSTSNNPPAGTCITSNINHQSIGGYSTGNYMQIVDGIPRIRGYLNANTPDVVLLHIGTNDMGSGSGSFQIGTYNDGSNQGTFTIGRIVQMIDEIYAKNNNAKILIADLIPVYNGASGYNSRISQLGALIGDVVDDRQMDGNDIRLVEVNSGFSQSMMQSDGIHPNASGESYIAGRFLSALQAEGICNSASPPSAVAKISPSGTTSDNTPTYSWNALPTATNYYLWVNDVNGSGTIKQQLSSSAVNCGSGSGQCSYTPSMAVSGSSTWWVQASNANGSGSWGTPMTFTTPSGSVPGVVSLVEPISGGAAASPQFVWNAQSSASNYYLWVNDPTGTVIQQTYSASQANCGSGSGTCQISPGTSLNSGDISWWVQASNAFGNGQWSARGAFVVGGVPGPASLLFPLGASAGANPPYSWNPVSNSSWYMLWVNENGSNKVARWYTAAQAGCPTGNETRCEINPPENSTSGSSSSWWVRTYNTAGMGAWSAQRDFTY